MAEPADSTNPYSPPSLAPQDVSSPLGTSLFEGPYSEGDLTQADKLATSITLFAQLAPAIVAAVFLALVCFRRLDWAGPVAAIYLLIVFLERQTPPSDLKHITFQTVERIELNAQGMQTTTPDGSEFHSWGCLCGWTGDSHTMLLFVSPEHYFMLCRRLARSPDDWRQANRLVRTNIRTRFTLRTRERLLPVHLDGTSKLWAANESIRRRRWSEADELLRAAIRLLQGESLAAAIAAQGRALYDAGRNQEAIESYDKSIAMHTLPMVCFSRGLAWEQLGEMAKSRSDFQLAIKGHCNLILNVGDKYLFSNQIDQALAIYERGVALGLVNARYGCGLCRLRLADYAGARADFREVLAQEPKHLAASQQLALSFAQEGEHALAIAAWEKHLEQHPDDRVAENHLHESFLNMGDLPRAVGWLTGLVAARPRDAKLHDKLAWLLATSRDPQVRNGPLAKSLAQKACDLTKGLDAKLLQTLAAAYAACGEFDEAVRRQTAILGRKDLSEEGQAAARVRLEHYEQRQPCLD